jgi:hypothetical protein
LGDAYFISDDLALCLYCIFGMVVDVKPRFTRDRLEEKKNMGMCRRVFEIIATVMTRFQAW